MGGVGCGSVEAAGTAGEMLWPRMRELSAPVVGDPAVNPLADPIILQKPAILLKSDTFYFFSYLVFVAGILTNGRLCNVSAS